mgnify:CR=1 FL=1
MSEPQTGYVPVDKIGVRRRATASIAVIGNPPGAISNDAYLELTDAYGSLVDRVEIGEVSFASQGRSRVMGQNRGLLRAHLGDLGIPVIVYSTYRAGQAAEEPI